MGLQENAEEGLRRYRLSIREGYGQELLRGHTIGPLNTPVPRDGPKNDELWH